MKITSVTVRKIEKENSRMKGIASVLIDDCFAVVDVLHCISQSLSNCNV